MATTQPAQIRPEEVGTEWMTWALRRSGTLADGARVTSVDREPCGTGQLADSYRFTLGYDSPGAGPGTVVGKFASEDPASRAFGQQSGYYRTEIRFYQQLAPRLSAVALPTALHAEVADDGAEFVLLMDDLAPARVVDQLSGCTVDEAALVVRQLAALHAGSWRNDQLATTDWLHGAIASFTDITANFRATVEAFPATFGDLVSESDLRQAAKLNAHLAEWNSLISTPLCLWHSDIRADNLLFDARGGRTPVALLDWQATRMHFAKPADYGPPQEAAYRSAVAMLRNHYEAGLLEAESMVERANGFNEEFDSVQSAAVRHPFLQWVEMRAEAALGKEHPATIRARYYRGVFSSTDRRQQAGACPVRGSAADL